MNDGTAAAAVRQRKVGGSLATARRQQCGSCGGGGSATADVGGSLAAARQWRQRDSATLAADWRRRCSGCAQHDSGSTVAEARWLQWWWQRDIVTIPMIALSSHLNDSTSHAAFQYSVASIDAEGQTFNNGN